MGLFWVGKQASATSLPQEASEFDRFQMLGLKLDSWSVGQIQFWKKIYTQYGTHDWVIHDSENLTRIYQIHSGTNAATSEKEAHRAKQEIHRILQAIYEKNKSKKIIAVNLLSTEERKYFEILDANEDPRAFLFAANPERIRVQRGQKDRLENGYSISTRYLKRMEEIFIEEGVPKELTRLPFVESAFVKEAKSNVGALGVWQFMPKTAEKDLKMTVAIDERYDPLKSTRAAARFLKQNYRQLKSWALAVMAYHHGAGLVGKAMKKLKTDDPIQIIKLFKNSNFQFASRNYLFEFLAMLEVDESHELFFKNENRSPLPTYITVSFPIKMSLQKILNFYHLKKESVQLLNPHFLTPLWNGNASLPSHYPIRLAGITLEEFHKLGYPASR